MADLKKSADTLLAEMASAIRSDFARTLHPILRKIADAAAELERALGGTAPRRRGRPPKNAAAVIAAPTGRRRGRPPGARRKKAPRGALKAVILDVLKAAGTPLSLTGLRDGVIKHPLFSGRDPMTLYRQIVRDVQKIPKVRRGDDGRYGLGSGVVAAGSTPVKRRGKPGRRGPRRPATVKSGGSAKG